MCSLIYEKQACVSVILLTCLSVSTQIRGIWKIWELWKYEKICTLWYLQKLLLCHNIRYLRWSYQITHNIFAEFYRIARISLLGVSAFSELFMQHEPYKIPYLDEGVRFYFGICSLIKLLAYLLFFYKNDFVIICHFSI